MTTILYLLEAFHISYFVCVNLNESGKPYLLLSYMCTTISGYEFQSARIYFAMTRFTKDMHFLLGSRCSLFFLSQINLVFDLNLLYCIQKIQV